MKDVTIIIPSGYPEKLKKCLSYLLMYTTDETIYIDRIKSSAVASLIRLLNAVTTKYVAFVSDDQTVTEGWVERAVKCYEDNYDGKPLYVGFKYVGQPLLTIHGKPYVFNGLMLTEDLKKIGGFDRGYRHYYLDPDLCMRVWQAGGKLVICPGEMYMEPGNRERMNEYLGSDAQIFSKYWGSARS